VSDSLSISLGRVDGWASNGMTFDHVFEKRLGSVARTQALLLNWYAAVKELGKLPP